MRKFLLLLLSFIVSVVTVNAGKVSEKEALQKALQFMPGKSFVSLKTSDKTFARGDDSQTAFYIFNVEGNDGFVIISADDRTEPVLGFSRTGKIDMDDMPDNLRYWLDCYVEQIASLDESNPSITPVGTRSARAKISPLVQTKWDQGEPYWNDCPTYQGHTCVTGCLATALAQVMYYHKWPETSKSIPAYTTQSRKIKQSELPSYSFKWDLMKTEYNGSKDDADAQDAVAKLMHYCGQAMQMDYDPDGSGAYVHADAIIDYFNYTKNLKYLPRYWYTAKQWEELVYQELSQKRPILYTGQSTDGGHAFVCDGYEDGLFHINWGWGGSSDGFFLLSVLDPIEQGTGGSSGGYSYDQSAVFGMQKAAANEDELPDIPYIESKIPNDFTGAEYTRASTSDDFVNVSVKGYICPHYPIVPTTTYPVKIGWALCQNGKMKTVFENANLEINQTELQQGYYYMYYNNMDLSFGSGLSDGKYQLCQVYQISGENEWRFCEAAFSACIVAEVNGTSLLTRTVAVDYKINSMDVPNDLAKGLKSIIVLNLTNTGEAVQNVIYVWMDSKLVGQALASIDPGETDDLAIEVVPGSAGTLSLTVTTDANGQNIIGNAHVEVGDLIKTTKSYINYQCNTLSKKATVIGSTFTSNHAVVIPSYIEEKGVSYAVKAIAPESFVQNNKVVSVTIGEGVETIGSYAFWNANGLTKLIIGEGTKTIGTQAFAYCRNLAEIVLPSTLTSIGQGAFISMGGGQESVTCNIKQPSAIGDDVFLNYDYDAQTYEAPVSTLYVPYGTKSKYQTTDGWKLFTNIEEMVEKIPVSSAQQLAYYSDRDLDFTNVSGVKAYVATGYDKTNGTIWLSRVYDVPAYTGILLIGEAKTYEVPATVSSSRSYFKNMFKGTVKGTTIQTTDGAYTNYYLSKGTDGVGFYKVKEGGVDLPANRAYLSIPTNIEAVGTAGSSVSISVGSAGQVPYYSDQSLDFTTMEAKGMKAYTATGYNYSSGTIWLSRVNKVPALTGVLIMAPKGKYDVPTASVASVYENMFKGTLEGTTIFTEEDGFINYYLSNGTDGVGFYKVTKEDGVALSANRCYLPIPRTRPVAAARGAEPFDVGADLNCFGTFNTSETIGIRLYSTGGQGVGTTGIESIDNGQLTIENDSFYNLNGQRVDNPRKGIFIKNGHKVVIK